MNDPKIAIVGAGLCGSLMANYFSARGFNVDVFEARLDIRTLSGTSGRSINLALSHRGIHALKKVGLFEKVKPLMLPMKGRMIHQAGQPLELQPYGVQDDHVIYSVSRRMLNQVLVEAADVDPQIHLYFDHKCMDIDFTTKTLTLKQHPSGERVSRTYDVLFGTDGAFSKVRQRMMRKGRFNYSQHYISHGYKELTLAPGEGGSFQLDPEALHIWPQKSFMLIALPNTDGSFTLTLFLDFEGDISFAALNDQSKVRAFFKEYFPDLSGFLPDLEDEFFQNPTGEMISVSVDPWHLGQSAMILGDATHAIVPFYGQGMNASFEDVRLFFEVFDQNQNLEKTIAIFSQKRKPDTDAIAGMALENFIEMRDGVIDPTYLERRKLEQALEKDQDSNFQSKYTMVSFTDIPYAKAKRLALENKKIIEGMLKA